MGVSLETNKEIHMQTSIKTMFTNGVIGGSGIHLVGDLQSAFISLGKVDV